MFNLLWCFEVNLGRECIWNTYYYLSHDLGVIQWSFGSCTVNIDTHALNLNNQYLTLLYVYKLAACTITLHSVQVMYTTSCKVVQLTYRPLRHFQTTLRPTLCYVHTDNVSHYTPHSVSVMEGRFQSCAVNVDAHTLNLNNQNLNFL